MAQFVLQECRVRGQVLAPVRDAAALTLDWDQLCEKLAPSGRLSSRLTLRKLQPGCYVGLIAGKRGTENFILLNQDRSGKIGWLVRKDPDALARIQEVYRVERTVWDHKFLEEEASTP